MIVSASRRTDIPAFYGQWFLRRAEQGYCLVPNPFNPSRVARVSLRPGDVDAVAFWTRDPRPFMHHLDRLDELGFKYFFHYTLLGSPRELDPGCPPLQRGLETIRRLADRLGPGGVTWRYDPIVLSSATDADWHRRRFERISRALEGRAVRVIVSFLQYYKKLERRLAGLARHGVAVRWPGLEERGALLAELGAMARARSMALSVCAPQDDYGPWGVGPARCIDPEYLRTWLGVDVPEAKDPAQRPGCGCAVSKDIGMYDSCVFGCRYCYATQDFAASRANRRRHDPESESLLPLAPGAQVQGNLLG